MSDTLRTLSLQNMSGTIVSCNDHLQIGRLQFYPDSWSENKVPIEQAPWIHMNWLGSQTMNGSTPHSESGLRPGHRITCSFDADGTGHMVTSHTQSAGGDAPAGSGQMTQFDPTYPGNPAQETGSGGGGIA